MTLENNKALVRRWLKMGEQGFVGDFHEYFTADYSGHLAGQPTQSLDDLVRLERGFAAAFSDISYEVADLFAADDKVVLRVATRATHTRAFYGIEATGRPVTMTGIVIYRFVDEKIAFMGRVGLPRLVQTIAKHVNQIRKRPLSGEVFTVRTSAPGRFTPSDRSDKGPFVRRRIR